MCGSRPGPTGRSPASSELAPRDAPGTLDLNKLVHRSGGGIGRALLPRPDEARQRGADPADDPLADPNATRFYEAQQRGADRRVALGRRVPAACSRGVDP
jgi:hypothetical protein